MNDRDQFIHSANMSEEILEALREYYKDNQDLITDCLLFLKNFNKSKDYQTKFRNNIDLELEKMGRCVICGDQLKYIKIREFHTELQNNPYEDKIMKVCLNCDI